MTPEEKLTELRDQLAQLLTKATPDTLALASIFVEIERCLDEIERGELTARKRFL